ncbi:adhesion G-protein coupled receptor D1-like [Anneissia japonica]|nr:adhesion G-protein coupled receptor D1-like [Anneissia japonica]
MLLLTPAVGLSWIFGVIIVFCHSEMMEYVFVFINSMQGFYIWLTQCALSGEVQLALKKRFKNRTGHDISINTISSTTNTNRVTIEEL